MAENNDQIQEPAQDIPGLQIYREFSSSRPTNDAQECQITDVVMLKSGTILAADYNNFTLKAFDQDGNFLSDLYFEQNKKDYFVRCIAIKDETSVYVTLPGTRRIALVRVDEEQRDTSEGKLSDKKVSLTATTVPTVRRYHGIAHIVTHSCLAVGTTYKRNDSTVGIVDILNYDGELMRHVEPNATTPFRNPTNIAATGKGEILVSDSINNCIFLIADDFTVNVLALGEPWLQLRGVTSDECGVILFCGEKSTCIQMICPGTRARRNILPNPQLKEPLGIHFQNIAGTKWVVVSQRDGCIKVYKMS